MNPEVKCACLDFLHDVFHTYGNLVASYHELLLDALLPQLCLNHTSVRKDSVSCIGKMDQSFISCSGPCSKLEDYFLHVVAHSLSKI